MATTRRRFTAQFKAKVAMEALRTRFIRIRPHRRSGLQAIAGSGRAGPSACQARIRMPTAGIEQVHRLKRTETGQRNARRGWRSEQERRRPAWGARASAGGEQSRWKKLSTYTQARSPPPRTLPPLPPPDLDEEGRVDNQRNTPHNTPLTVQLTVATSLPGPSWPALRDATTATETLMSRRGSRPFRLRHSDRRRRVLRPTTTCAGWRRVPPAHADDRTGARWFELDPAMPTARSRSNRPVGESDRLAMYDELYLQCSTSRGRHLAARGYRHRCKRASRAPASRTRSTASVAGAYD